jgi:hypothetical protein
MVARMSLGDAVATSTGGCPPALFDQHVEAAETLLRDAKDRVDLVAVVDIGCDVDAPLPLGIVGRGRRAVERGSRAGDDGPACAEKRPRDAQTDPLTPTRDDHDRPCARQVRRCMA